MAKSPAALSDDIKTSANFANKAKGPNIFLKPLTIVLVEAAEEACEIAALSKGPLSNSSFVNPVCSSASSSLRPFSFIKAFALAIWKLVDSILAPTFLAFSPA